jgi:hypothetical protein
MTDDRIALCQLLEKSSDADLLREMIDFAAERLMALEVEGLTGAGYGERSPERLRQRNGYRDRSWETRAGTVELRIPKLGPRRSADRRSFGAGGSACCGSWAATSRASSSRGGWPRRR